MELAEDYWYNRSCTTEYSAREGKNLNQLVGMALVNAINVKTPASGALIALSGETLVGTFGSTLVSGFLCTWASEITNKTRSTNMKKCPFCAEEVLDEAIVCKHCGKELDSRKVKAKSYRWGLGRIFLAVVFTGIVLSVVLASFSDTEENRAPVQTPPSFQETEVTIDSDEFNYIDPPLVNVWPSYNDRSRVVATLERGEGVTLTGYDRTNDYCKIRTAENKGGWIACGWVKNLPPQLR